jgi:hypothetical protein
MSALPPKADMSGEQPHVRFGPIADIAPFTPEDRVQFKNYQTGMALPHVRLGRSKTFQLLVRTGVHSNVEVGFRH